MSHLPSRKNSKLRFQRSFFTTILSFLLIGYAIAAPETSIAPAADIFSKCWDYKVDSKLDSGIAVDTTSVYFLDDENKLTGVDLTTGNKLWSTELGGPVISNLLILRDSILFVTSSQSERPNAVSRVTLRSTSRRTGITEWTAEVTSAPQVWIGFVNDQIVTVGADGSVSALANGGGKLIWQRNLNSIVTATPYFYKTGVEVATTKNEVLSISGSDGRVHLDWMSEFLPTAILIDTKGRLVVGDERGNFVSVSSDGTRLWGFRNGAQISSATLFGTDYLAASYDNFLYKLSRHGNVKWKRRLSGRINDGPFILGNTAVVSIVGTGSVYVLDLENGKISNRIEMGDEVTVRVASARNGSGFAVAAPGEITYFSTTKCPAK